MYTDYSCELNDSRYELDEVHTLELRLLMFNTLSITWCNLNVFGRGQLSPNLSFFGWGWHPVPVLVEGCGSLVGGQGHLGVEKQGGVSFIRAETATEAIFVSIDSSSVSSMSNESTQKKSFVTSATVLKEISLMGVGALASFVDVGVLGVLQSNLAFASAYCTTKTAWQQSVSLTVQQYLWAFDFILRRLSVDLS